MTLTLANLRAQLRHAIGGGIADGLDERQVVNEAGRHFYNLRPWRFRVRGTTLGITADQDYIELPDDIDEIVNIHGKVGLTFRLTTPVDFGAKSDRPAMNHTEYWCIDVQPGKSGPQSRQQRRLRLWPVPIETRANAMGIWYRAAWPDLFEDTDVADVPAWAEMLLILTVRAVAQGYQEDRIIETLSVLEQSPPFTAAAIQDGFQTPDWSRPPLPMQASGRQP